MNIGKLTSRGALLLFSIFVASCADYDNGYEQKKLEYEKNFKELFGDIDPNQDWNMARQYDELCKRRSEAIETRASSRARGEAAPTEFGLYSYADQHTGNDWAVPTGWTISCLGPTLVTPEEMRKADKEWPEGTATEKFASVDSYYISDGTPLHFRLIWSQTDGNDIVGVYDVEHPWLRLPVLANKSTEFPNGAGLASGSFAGLKDDNNYNGRVYSNEYLVYIPAGTKYGFYLERMDAAYGNNTGHGHTHFSESALTANNPASAGSECDKYNVVLSKDGSMVGFEDAHDGFVDYNDMVLHVDPPVIENLVSVQSWIVACEDLGNTDDIDFNDVVLEVSQDETNVTLKPLAAGATLNSNVLFNSTDLGEIHSWMGAGEGEWVNTQGDYPSESYTPKEVTVASDFNLKNQLSAGVVSLNTIQYDNGHYNSTIINNGNVTGGAPMMLVLPANWEWPSERTRIYDAYPKFKDWVKDSSNDDWFLTKTPGAFIKRHVREEEVAPIDPDDPDTPVDPVTPSEDSEVYGYRVNENTTLGTGAKDRFISPSYFANAEEYVIISVVNSTETSLYATSSEYCVKDGTATQMGSGGKYILSGDTWPSTVCIKVTGDELKFIKQFGVMIFVYNTDVWSDGAQIFVKIDSEIGDPEEGGEEPGQGGEDPGQGGEGPGEGGGASGGNFTPVDHDYTSFTAKQVLDISGDFTSGASSAKITVDSDDTAGYIYVSDMGVYIGGIWAFNMSVVAAPGGSKEYPLTSAQLSSAISGGIEIRLGDAIVGLTKINVKLE